MNITEENKEYIKKLVKISDLFIDEKNDEALEELYNLTNDDLIPVLKKIKQEYFIDLNDYNNISTAIYMDLVNHLEEKYKLDEIYEDIDEIKKSIGMKLEETDTIEDYDY